MNNGGGSILKRVNDDELKSDEIVFTDCGNEKKVAVIFGSSPIARTAELRVCRGITFIKHL